MTCFKCNLPIDPKAHLRTSEGPCHVHCWIEHTKP